VKVPATDPVDPNGRFLGVIRLLEASRRHCPLDTDARTTSVNDYVNKTAVARTPDILAGATQLRGGLNFTGPL